MKSRTGIRASVRAVIVFVAGICFFRFVAFGQSGGFQPDPAGATNIVVHPKFGGLILGYDVDRNGAEGVLSEVIILRDGKGRVATETFDQKTGKILKVVAQLNETNTEFITLGVVGKSVGLVEREDAKGVFVDKRSYRTLNPLNSNRFTGVWKPHLNKHESIFGVSQSQEGPNTAFLVGGGTIQRPQTFVLSSNVAANTFGPLIALKDPNFVTNSPVVALDSKSNVALIGTGGADPFGPPLLATVDLVKGKVSEFQGLGSGLINGIALDPETGVACTATSIDSSVEFYNFRKKVGFLIETLPGATGQIYSGADVEFDPIHKLFLVGQPVSSTTSSGSSIQVYDEKGNFVESINGLQSPISSVTPARIAINPSTRAGFMVVAPLSNSLQSFTY